MNPRAIVGLVAAALVIILAAIPILTSTVQFTEIQDNEGGSPPFSAYSGETIQISYGDVVTVNGVAQTSFYFYSSAFSVFWDGSSNYVNDWSNELHFEPVAGDTLTFSRHAVSGTGTLAALDVNIPKGQAIYTDADGDLMRFNGEFYLDKTSVFYIVTVNSPAIFAKGTLGNVDNYLSKGYNGTAFVDYTVSDITVTSEPVEGTSNLVKVTGKSYTSEDTVKTNAMIIAPLEYHAPSDGGTMGTLVDVVPLFMVVSLLIAAVGIMRRH